ncbi:hypothetical protein [Sinorhizobium meliloti]|nr:hypothetical protein [Sinorhizobium meliloti]
MRYPLAEHLLPDVNGPQWPFDRLVYAAAALAVVVGVARLFT